jgi:superfamily II DNA helicase RecQ
MSLRFFVVPVYDASAFEQELNRFLAGHKIVSIQRQLIDQGANSFWAICVDYLSHAPGQTPSSTNLSRSRVDYKAILSTEEFTVYSRLRDLRKELAQSEAVPVYALFTNEQLAMMVQRRCRSKNDLSQIEGIGEGKIDKYGERMLPLLQTLEARQDASSSEPI